MKKIEIFLKKKVWRSIKDSDDEFLKVLKLSRVVNGFEAIVGFTSLCITSVVVYYIISTTEVLMATCVIMFFVSLLFGFLSEITKIKNDVTMEIEYEIAKTELEKEVIVIQSKENV